MQVQKEHEKESQAIGVEMQKLLTRIEKLRDAVQEDIDDADGNQDVEALDDFNGALECAGSSLESAQEELPVYQPEPEPSNS